MQRCLYILILSFLSFNLLGRETITVTVTGLGTTIEAARKNAIQKAVRKALGEVVDAETIAKNGELIKDEVLTYSDGFINQTLDLSGPEKDTDLGLFSLTIQAEVIRSKVVKRLKEVNIKVVEIDGNSLFAQALSKMDKAESGKSLLAKALNEDLDPAKLIKCDLIHRDTNGRLVRGSYGPDAIKIVGDNEIELTTLWEISVDLDAYYNQALPRIIKILNQVSKRQISRSTKRVMDTNDAWDRNLIYHNYITKKPFLWEDDYAILAHTGAGGNVYFGKDNYFHVDLSQSGEPKESPWRMNSRNKSILIAIELRSNPSRSECDFGVYELDYDTYSDLLFDFPALVFPDFKFSSLDKDQKIITERNISAQETNFGPKGPSFLIGNNENQKIELLFIPTCRIPKSSNPKENNDFKRELMGIAKFYRFERSSEFCPPCLTISPEFICEDGRPGGYSDLYRSSHQDIFLNNSIVMDIKEKLSVEQAKQIASLSIQPISRIPK